MIGIIAAMDSEVDAIVAISEDVQKQTIANLDFYTGSIASHEIVIVKSGIGIGFASMSATVMHENFPIDKVLNIGTAGGLDHAQHALDVVVSEKVAQYMYETGPQNPRGMFFLPDVDLVACCKRVFKDMDVTSHFGLIISGDQFVYRENQVQDIKENFPTAMCVEMEAGAVAQVCAQYKTPFVVIRSLSDITVEEGSEMAFDEYVVHAAKRSADFTKRMLLEL